MTIFSEQSNTGTMTLNYIASRVTAESVVSVVPPVDSLDFCLCDYECAYTEPAFGNTGGEEHTNDTTSLLWRLLDSGDTATITILKAGVVVATITDNTYGVYFPAGSFTTQPLYVGFVANWGLILDAFGAGRYTIKTDFVIFGSPFERITHDFYLLPYTDTEANGTVKLQTVNNGCIFNSEFDYTGLNWEQSVRFNGKFGGKTPEFETKEYEDSNRVRTQVQDKIVNSYELETSLIPSSISNVLIYDNLLANKIFITDYNLFNNEIYRKLPIRILEVSDAVYFTKNTNGRFVIRFTDKTDNIIKRNFK